MVTAFDRVYLAWLRQQVEQLFSKDELRTICFDLGVDYDGLAGKGKEGKVRELVIYLERRGRVEELVVVCERLRPNVDWQPKKVQYGGAEGTEDGRKEKGTPGNLPSQSRRWDLGGTQETSMERGANFEETGEPEWVEVAAGEFWMGSDKGGEWSRPMHRLYLDRFWIGRTPVTNAQYRLFVGATEQRPPHHWPQGVIPAGREEHPVVGVNWEEAMAYCRWLSGIVGKAITLPSEAEWEKAARGDQDQREYPWGDVFGVARANVKVTGVGTTSAVGAFPAGASPYGVLDMSGNVWEWTRSLWGGDHKKVRFSYPYVVGDGREDLDNRVYRIIRGGSWGNEKSWATCSARNRLAPDRQANNRTGFRVVQRF